jgi:hypothetical protein
MDVSDYQRLAVTSQLIDGSIKSILIFNAIGLSQRD